MRTDARRGWAGLALGLLLLMACGRGAVFLTIEAIGPDGALRIEVFLNPPTGRFGLRIIDEGPRVLTLREKQNILADALRNVTAQRTITEA